VAECRAPLSMAPLYSRPRVVLLSHRELDALAACIELARAAPGVFVGAGELAHNQALTARRCELALGPLIEAGVVRTRRGRGGGYRLARPADDVLAAAVVEAIRGREDTRDAGLPAAAGAVWLAKDLQRLMRQRLGEVTIAMLAAMM
jgi:Rrf2 family iron-sulfur cluster assembly transcriptional regulator